MLKTHLCQVSIRVNFHLLWLPVMVSGLVSIILNYLSLSLPKLKSYCHVISTCMLRTESILVPNTDSIHS